MKSTLRILHSHILHEHISFLHWNVNGWTLANSDLRLSVLRSMNLDIVSLNETHLQGETVIELDGYVWFGLNRKTHIKAHRASGGVGLLVRSSLFQDYNIEIVEKADGIVGLLLQQKFSGYCFVIFSSYLPPISEPIGCIRRLTSGRQRYSLWGQTPLFLGYCWRR